jgi:hypothetical protein
MRDYTKSGMTIPHEVILAVLRGFYRRDEKKMNRALRAFTDPVLYFKEGDQYVPKHPDTGLPLGMFVEGFTLLQYACHQYVSEQIGKMLEFNANNDDVIVGSRSHDVICAYRDADVALQQDLGMSVKGTKTGISNDRFIYCEEYWDGENILRKDCLYAMALLGAKYSVNIVHAKELAHTILRTCIDYTPVIDRALREVQSSFLFEFSPFETRWPFLFGGWLPAYKDGLDSSITYRNGDCIFDFAYWACQLGKKSRCNSFAPRATLALGRFYNVELIQKPDPSFYVSLKPLLGTKKALKEHYGLLSRSPRECKRHYVAQYLARRKIFNQFMTAERELPSVTAGYIRRHPNTVIIPGMEGVKYSKQGFVINNPRIGKKIDSFEAKLQMLQSLGIVSASVPGPPSGTHKDLYSMGITEELKYDFLPISDQGCSLAALQMHLPGLQDLWYEHGLFVSAIDDNDHPYELASRWLHFPAPLYWLIKLKRAIIALKLPFDIDAQTGRFFWEHLIREDFEAWRQNLVEELDDEEPHNDVPEDSSFEALLKSLIDSVNIESFKARIIPLSKEERDKANNGVGTTYIDGVEHILTAEGSWMPTTKADIASDFWDQASESGDEVNTYLWD